MIIEKFLRDPPLESGRDITARDHIYANAADADQARFFSQSSCDALIAQRSLVAAFQNWKMTFSDSQARCNPGCSRD